MLDIKYLKQIDEMFEVEGFGFPKVFSQNIDRNTIYLPDGPNNIEGLMYEAEIEVCSTWRLVYYPLYLQRVIEAINKDWTKADSDNYYWICQNYDDIEVYEQSSKREVFTLGVDCKSIDECKEKAITYVMDHIKEKV